METALSIPSNFSPTDTSLADERRLKNSVPFLKVSPFNVSINTCAFLDGATFISARRLRTAFTAVIILFICSSSSGNERASLNSAQGDSIIVSPSCGRVCHISSVINGINGCKSFSVFDITYTSTAFAVSFAFSSSPPRRIFESSIYQSQKTSHIKSYSF